MHDSLIFVLLIFAWLVVLVPMLAKHRQEVRRTADAALATRVLHRGDSGIRLSLRRRPARGHPSDPRWVPKPQERANEPDETEEVAVATQQHDHDEIREHDEHRDDGVNHGSHVAGAGEVELDEHYGTSPRRPGRGGFDPGADALARQARFGVRRRVASALLGAAVVTLLGALVGLGFLWWPQLVLDVALVGYLGYLRRQTRIEADVRERRLARIGRVRLGVDVADGPDQPGGTLPRRLRRPGAVVLEIDDEDPAFDELDYPAVPEEVRLPRAAGE
ncbi:MAG: gephyrin-like molybdotransferase receptor GlpR [Mycobacteriaceae bacterium]